MRKDLKINLEELSTAEALMINGGLTDFKHADDSDGLADGETGGGHVCYAYHDHVGKGDNGWFDEQYNNL